MHDWFATKMLQVKSEESTSTLVYHLLLRDEDIDDHIGDFFTIFADVIWFFEIYAVPLRLTVYFQY